MFNDEPTTPDDATGNRMSFFEEMLVMCTVLAPIYSVYLAAGRSTDAKYKMAAGRSTDETSLVAGGIALFATIGYWLVMWCYFPISGIVVATSLSVVPCFAFCMFYIAGESMRKQGLEETDGETDEEEDDDDEGNTVDAAIKTALLTALLAAMFAAALSRKVTKPVASTQLVVFEPHTPLYL